MSDSGDTWKEIQELKSKQFSLREKLARRKRAREEVVAQVAEIIAKPEGSAASTSAAASSAGTTGSPNVGIDSKVNIKTELGLASFSDIKPVIKTDPDAKPILTSAIPATSSVKTESIRTEPIDIKPKIEQFSAEELAETEKKLLQVLDDVSLNLPVEMEVLRTEICKARGVRKDQVAASMVDNLLQKFAAQMLVSVTIKESEMTRNMTMYVESVDHKKVSAVSDALEGELPDRKRKRDGNISDEEGLGSKEAKMSACSNDNPDTSIESLLSTQSAKERENKRLNEEILDLLSQPTAKEQSLVEKFKSQGGTQVKEFCQYGTLEECHRMIGSTQACGKLHFKKIINKHTDEALGDCSFLNTCFHMDTCKYVHYEIAYPEVAPKPRSDLQASKKTEGSTILYPPQWINCDLRKFDMSVLGKFAVIMADPPWDIHMELPYGTMQDNEMRNLNVPALQDDGYIFLWVTGRAMELGRECLTLWGYERVDELIWVKANQLQRIIRTGRTGHWLNHGKEHCLIGMKGNPKNMNRGLDCDVIVAEVRATSHKPDEIYGIIERLAPGSRKIELFGRPHNVQPNWITLGNQVDGVKLIDPDVVRAFKKKYPDGNIS